MLTARQKGWYKKEGRSPCLWKNAKISRVTEEGNSQGFEIWNLGQCGRDGSRELVVLQNPAARIERRRNIITQAF
jgi:hypothetical protein